jgi:hypothetical protein
MPSVRRRVHLRHSPAAVFAYLADFGHDPRWRSNVVAMRALGQPGDVGGVWSRQIEVRKVPGRLIETEAVVVAYEPARELAVQRAGGPIRPRARYRLSPEGPGTRLDFELEVDLRGWTWLAAPAVWLFLLLLVRPSLAGDFARLAAALDAAA